METYTTEKS